MLLCQLQPAFSGTPDSTEDSNVNWEEAASQMPQTQLLSCPNWIKQTKVQSDDSSCTHQSQFVDISSLNQQQLLVYKLVSTHYSTDGQQPLHMLILGTAGRGKSFLIQAIAQLLQNKLQLQE